MADENANTEPLDAESLGELLGRLAVENAREARVALAGRVINFMRGMAAQQAPLKAERVIELPDIGAIRDADDCYEAISRRLHQVRGMCALMGHAEKLAGEVEDDAFEYTMWGAKDLLVQADALARQLFYMVPEEKRAIVDSPMEDAVSAAA